MRLASDLRRIGRGCNLLLTVFTAKNMKSLQSTKLHENIRI